MMSPTLTLCAVSRHRTLMGVYDKFPYTDPTVWAAPNATVVGKVFLNRKSSVWYGAVIRGASMFLYLRAALFTQPLQET